MTSLVTLVANDTSLAEFRSNHILCGKSPGTVTVSVSGNSLLPGIEIVVTDDPVNVTSVLSRLITSAEWETTVSNPQAFEVAQSVRVHLRQVLTQKPVGASSADYGYVYTVLTFDDGAVLADPYAVSIEGSAASTLQVCDAEHDCSSEPGDLGYPTLALLSSTSYGCYDTLSELKAVVSRCGHVIGEGPIPAFFNPPSPESLSLTVDHNVLAATNTLAHLESVCPRRGSCNVATLIAIAHYSDGTSVTFRTPRATPLSPSTQMFRESHRRTAHPLLATP